MKQHTLQVYQLGLLNKLKIMKEYILISLIALLLSVGVMLLSIQDHNFRLTCLSGVTILLSLGYYMFNVVKEEF